MSLRYAQNNASVENTPQVDSTDALLQNPNAVLQIGTGQRIFKQNISGKVLNQLQTHYPSQADFRKYLKEALDQMGFNPNMQYSPAETQRFIQGAKEAIINSPIGEWISQANPELFRG